MRSVRAQHALDVARHLNVKLFLTTVFWKQRYKMAYM